MESKINIPIRYEIDWSLVETLEDLKLIFSTQQFYCYDSEPGFVD